LVGGIDNTPLLFNSIGLVITQGKIIKTGKTSDTDFNKTEILVELAQFKDERLISRSQAKKNIRKIG
jgi:hypothetical protein